MKWVALLLCCGSLLSEHLMALEESADSSFQIEQSLNQLLGEQAASRYQEILSPEELNSWEVYFPNNSSDELPGVLVYVSPRQSGQIDSRWRSVMDQQNLIYIAANNSGNKKRVNRRMVLALMALKALEKEHRFSADRMFVTGFSGGGRVASVLATQYPEVFGGAIYICGVDFWKDDQTPRVERLLQNRFVFLTGPRDFNLSETRSIYHRYLKAGAQNSMLMVVPGLSHEHPDAKAMTEALQFLDGELTTTP
jgi:predicted esterase